MSAELLDRACEKAGVLCSVVGFLQMKAYIALNEELALRVNTLNTVSPEMLGFRCRYLPLKDTPQIAVNFAVRGTAFHGRVVESVSWIVLEIVFEDDQLADLSHLGKLARNVITGGWQFHGELKIQDYGHCFYEYKTGPIDMEA